MLATLTKQSELDVFVAVFALVLLTRRWRLLGGVVVGAAVTLLLVLQVAHGLGTSPGGLWEAMVTFRGDAARVIAESATYTTPRRLAGVLAALVGSAAPFVAVGLLVNCAAPRRTACATCAGSPWPCSRGSCSWCWPAGDWLTT